MERPGILYLTPALKYAVGRLVVDIMREAHGKGARVFLVTGSGRAVPEDDPALVSEASAVMDGSATLDLFARDAETMEQAEDEVGRLCLEWEIDAAHAFTAVAAAAAVTHTHTVATVIGWSPKKTREQRVMDAGILRRCDIVTALSDAVVDVLWQAGLERPDIKLIRHGVPIPAYVTRPKRGPIRTLGVKTPLIERRGVDVLLRALALVPSAPFSRLIIAGTGHAEEELRALAESLQLSCDVVWAPEMSAREFLDEVDLAIIPSRSDALPMGLLQAMAAGVPTVATRVGGIPEVVRDGVDGLLVPPDDPVSLSLALWSSAESPSLARARAENARRRVTQEFTIDGMLGKYLACYEELGLGVRSGADPVRTLDRFDRLDAH
jgi:glycosyltransferase involved in cell wall biosynthesis